MESGNMRMDFQQQLELQKKQVPNRTQAEIASRLNAKSTRKMLWQKGCSELIRNLTSVEKQMLSVERTSQNAVSTPSSRFEFSCNRKAKLLQRRVAPAKETTLNLSLIYDG
ncbi:hypothetical protein Tco_0216428 [Tanacetum coccineum]